MSKINVQEMDKEKEKKTPDPKKYMRKFSTMSMVDGGNMTIMDPKLGNTPHATWFLKYSC